MDFRHRLRMPPRTKSFVGKERRVGVEIEFSSVSARSGADLVHSLFGGVIEEEDPHRFYIRSTELGDFISELDTQYAHQGHVGEREVESTWGDRSENFVGSFGQGIRKVYGDISSVIVPCEIVCPPIALSDMQRLNELIAGLKHAGAVGTQNSPFYAFAAHLNPEIASDDPAWLVGVLKAYLLVSPWLRAVMEMDSTRQVASFAEPFPEGYVLKVVDPSYWPSKDELIADYIEANATRNRELDLLPLFKWLDAERVTALVEDARVKARPTFHYRLPDAKLGDTSWSLALEWNRWLVVERLAEETATLAEMGHAYRANSAQFMSKSWAMMSSEWLVLS